jgi:L-amino acid N-acyltransferase YncA
MSLRDAAESDLPAITEIFNATIPSRMVTAELEPLSVTDRLPWFREHSPDRHPIWVMELDGRVAGWLSFSRFITRCAYRGTAEISVYVHQDFRRRGVAGELLAAAIMRGPAFELTALIGLIFAHNEASLRLFERFGFARWGHLPRVARLDGVKRDLVIVGLPIGDGD